MVRPQRKLALLVYVAVGLAAWFHLGVSWAGQTAGLRRRHFPARTTMHPWFKTNTYGYKADPPMGGPVVEPSDRPDRPESSSAHKYRISRKLRRVPDGVDRVYSPGRPLFLNRSFINTLEVATADEGKGGLGGRWREDIRRHLQEVKSLAAAGETPEVAMFWDIENMRFPDEYRDPPAAMMKILKWCAGLLEAPITHAEAVEFTRYSSTRQDFWNSGYIEKEWILRKIGGVVHRAWPRVSERADEILLERMRDHLDMMQNGTMAKKMLFVLSGDKGFWPLLQAAQRYGVTCCTLGKHEIGRYFPAGLDFSVTFQIPRLRTMTAFLIDKKVDIWRPPEEWKPEHGPRLWAPGEVNLVPAPHLEQDRRIMHDFIDKSALGGDPARFDGTYRRSFRLNMTLAQTLQLRLEGHRGHKFRFAGYLHQTENRFRRFTQSDREAIETALQQLSQLSPEDNAAVFWNWDDMQVGNAGAPQRELFARFVKFFEGFIGMPLKCLEAAFFVEPWEQKFGGTAQDWRYTMQKAGGFIHRIWPPKAEAGKTSLMKRVGALAREANLAREEGRSLEGIPRFVCVLAEDLIFDEQLRMAQKAGISGLWLGPEHHGIFYPSGTEAKIEISIPLWQHIREDLAMAMRNPFLPGASTPDCPLPVYSKQLVPADPNWGEPDKLQLASLQVSEEPTTSRIGIGIL